MSDTEPEPKKDAVILALQRLREAAQLSSSQSPSQEPRQQEHSEKPGEPREKPSIFETFKAGSWFLLGLAILALLAAIGLALPYGLVWVSAKLYPIVEGLSLLGLIVFLVCLLLSIFKRIRRHCGNGMVLVSYLWGVGLWMYSILALYDLWGVAGIYIGFFTLGYVTVPLACLALLFEGEWSLLGQVVLWLIIVLSVRMLGRWIISKGPE